MGEGGVNAELVAAISVSQEAISATLLEIQRAGEHGVIYIWGRSGVSSGKHKEVRGSLSQSSLKLLNFTVGYK